MKTCTVYLHANKEEMSELGKEIGFEGEVLAMFRHALTEVEIEISIDENTGIATITKVDGIKLPTH